MAHQTILDIINRYPQIVLLYNNERKGKVAAINRAMTTISTDYVIFCDANTFLNKDCVKEIVKHYTDDQIGAVAGEKKVIAPASLLNHHRKVKAYIGNMNQF